mmetsp:Transcript_12657/g.18185  ORF Transcript_12657/g.18185 Transcript_12657/m.18185 type:complete len:206 (+) Transcript_12657:63-680(+)
MSPEEMPTCTNSLCSNKGIKRCTRCQYVLYCSRECQVAHWKRHKAFCNKMSCPKNQDRLEQAEMHSKSGYDLYKRGHYKEALEEYRKTLSVYRELLGEDHRDTATVYEDIGNVLLDQDQPDQALLGYRKSLEIRQKLVGEDHIDTAQSYCNIGNALAYKDHDEALLSLRKAQAIYIRQFSETHPATLETQRVIDQLLILKEEAKK